MLRKIVHFFPREFSSSKKRQQKNSGQRNTMHAVYSPKVEGIAVCLSGLGVQSHLLYGNKYLIPDHDRERFFFILSRFEMML